MKMLQLTTILIFLSALAFSQSAVINYSQQIGGSDDDVFNRNGIAHNYLWSVGYTNSNDILTKQKFGDTKAWIYGCNYAGDSVLNTIINGSGTDIANDIIEGGGNNIIVVGQTSSTDGDFSSTSPYGSYDAFLAIVDTLGNISYINKYGGSGYDGILRIIHAQNNGYLLIGYSDSNDGTLPDNGNTDKDAWLLRLSSTLDSLWSIKIGAVNQQSFNDGVSTDDNGFIVSGTHLLPKDGTPYLRAMKFNSVGIFDWEVYGGGSSSDIATGIHECNDGNYMLFGGVSSDDGSVHDYLGNSDGYVVKFNSTGDTLWTKCLGWESSYDIVSDIFEYNGKYYALLTTDYTGTEFTSYGIHDIALIEFDQHNQTFINHFGGEGTEPYTEGVNISAQIVNNQILVSSSSNSTTDDLTSSHGGSDGWIFSIDIVTALESNELHHEISLHPNPAKNSIQLELSKLENFPIGYTILDNQGKLVQKGLIQQASEKINIQNLPNGIYHIKTDNPYCKANSFVKD